MEYGVIDIMDRRIKKAEEEDDLIRNQFVNQSKKYIIFIELNEKYHDQQRVYFEHNLRIMRQHIVVFMMVFMNDCENIVEVVIANMRDIGNEHEYEKNDDAE
jgi:hypothetical protein